MIKTENLSKTFSSGTKAVDNLSINVEDGEIYGFLGPNGAGKSTTIKILTTLSRPTSGQAWVGGYNVQTEPVKVRCAIGYVAQETGVDYFLSGRENLVLQGRMYRMDRKTINRRVDELLELFSIKDCADQLVSTYSGGMRRKLDIATALIHNPRLIFLDEPTLGLDPHSRSQLWNYIRMLNRDLKVTIFLTTHYLDEADKLSNRIGILHKGSIKIIDTPDKLKDSIRGDSVNLELKGSAKDKAISILKGDSRVKEILLENEHVRVYVNNGSEAIQWMIKLLNQNGIDVSSLSISRPSLDDVYLKYSGASFKEGDSEEGGEPWWAKWQKAGWGKNWKGGEDSGQDSQEGQEGGQQGWGNGSKEWAGSENNGDTVPENGDKEWGKWSPEEMTAWWNQNKSQESETSPDNGNTNDIGEEAPEETTEWLDKFTKGVCEMEKDDKVEVTADKGKEDIKDKENKEEENIEEPWKKWQGTPEAAEWWAKQGKKEG
ncbi:MAG: ATP-binding cassette domain-containing protein [Nitrospirae bacterium]|nr:ATP-binding cassette domain-containing protein [Nitrospirota bacterium]